MSSTADGVLTASLLRIANVGRIFAEPSQVYDEEVARPNALVPLAVFLFLMSMEILIMAGPVATLAVNGLPEAMRAEAGPQLRAIIEGNRLVAMLFSPLQHLVRLLLLASLIHGAALLLGGDDAKVDGAFHRSFSLAVYASFALAAEELANIAAMWALGWERIQYFWDLKPVVGLHYLVGDPEAHRVAFTALQRVNPFAALYAFLLALGMRRMFQLSWRSAWAVALTANAAGIGVVALLAALRS